MTTSHCPDLRGTHFAVTGASGFIGRHLVKALVAAGAQVTPLRRAGRAAAGATSAPLDQAGVRGACDVDWSNAAACAAVLTRLQPTHLVHLAGYARSERSVAVLREVLDANLIATTNLLLAAMDAVPTARVVLAGSLETADPWRGRVALGSPYGISKAMLEVLAGGLQGLYGAAVVTAKIGMVYGPDDPNGHRLVPTLIRSLLRGEEPVLSSGTRRCDWVHVADVADALMGAAMLPALKQPSVDIGTGVLHSVRQVAEIIQACIGGSVGPVYSAHLDRPHEQERAADLSFLAGWSPHHALAQGLAETVAWYRAQPR